MSTRWLLILLLASASFAFAQDGSQAKKEPLEGEWVANIAETDGKKLSWFSLIWSFRPVELAGKG